MNAIGILPFEQKYVERIWGGRKLEHLFNLPLPAAAPIGEAWLVSDHAQHISVVNAGPHAGRTLHDLLVDTPEALLGTLAEPTIHGRFPLMLKLLDAAAWLSIQVHPNDSDAERLNESDVGKTEMWHVLQADADSELICGLAPGVDSSTLQRALSEDRILDTLERFAVHEQDSVFVPAGTIHAIGPGTVLAEIQQNSDLTYRIHDWNRLGADGNPRELHLEKAIDVTNFNASHRGPQHPLPIDGDTYRRSILAACTYFASERVEVETEYSRDTKNQSFHIILAESGTLEVRDAPHSAGLAPGKALLVPADTGAFSVTGTGTFLDYYVPDLERDIFEPLLGVGHSRDDILALGPQHR